MGVEDVFRPPHAVAPAHGRTFTAAILPKEEAACQYVINPHATPKKLNVFSDRTRH